MTAHWPLAVSTGCCRRSSLPAVLQTLVAAGATRAEIGTPPEHFNADDRLQPWRLAPELDRVPIDAISIHAPFGPRMDLASGHQAYREAAIEGALLAARTLIGRPGSVVVAHPSDLPRDSSDTRARLRDALESLLLVDAVCRDLGLRVAVETPLPHLIGGHPDELAWLLERLPPAVGVCLDTGHAHLGRFIDAFIDMAGPRLAHVHLHDNRGTYDDHLIPGEGAIDWGRFFDGLRRVGYRGALVLELSCDSPSAAHFRAALEAARRLFHAHAPSMLPAAGSAPILEV
jgi:sugar phosphate isomerase/epimerase